LNVDCATSAINCSFGELARPGHLQVGHLPAELAELYADPLAAIARSGHLVTGVGRIWAKDDGSGMVRARVAMLIPEVDLLES